MSAVEDKLRAEIAGYEAERELLNKVLREARSELRVEEARRRVRAKQQRQGGPTDAARSRE